MVFLSQISELEAEKDQLQDELQQVRRLLEAQKCQTARLEFDRLDKDNELQRLKKSAEKTISCFRQLEKEKIELEVENAKMQSFVHISKMTSQKFEDSERQRQDLEEQVEMASKERVKLEKEISRMRQNLDVKETLLEDVTSKMRVLELDHKSLQGYMEQAKNMTARVKELQKENKELIVEATSDKKALSALREVGYRFTFFLSIFVFTESGIVDTFYSFSDLLDLTSWWWWWWWWCRPHPVREHAQDLRPPLGARPASPPTRQAAQPPPRGSSTNPRPLA